MKNTILVLATTLFFVVSFSLFTGCGGEGAPKTDAADAVAAKYACPMHPDETSDVEGATCGKCGMPLTLGGVSAEADMGEAPMETAADDAAQGEMMDDSTAMEGEMEEGDEAEADEHEGHNH